MLICGAMRTLNLEYINLQLQYIIVPLIFLVILLQVGKAQTNELITKFNHSINTEERFALAMDLCRSYINTSPDTSLVFLNEVMTDSAKVKDKVLVGDCLNAKCMAID
ncbi:MAG: hypothetical protein BGO29_08820 [Bacteroidales bacterium 36-12]|nr:MAG: hypothetical protein BGO29_08820 [Bacteroidales bacterium 36-12]